ncbi:multiple sugar transport system substrate-binding protein [Diaminobutyricimonas aerilata]|uniref:Multiple sugar transport system substrate-binding protein n=1 Tax=Diaminobutyricimonas aerilata TaxID=1162967 RepID=A0A2M9CLS8_9MICO|nr:extracellular solute-binding protein [Diaminobutyricimonas aerilata]PJJ72840.1 multiple sugar transport system substrate-binding protein [Diaminobutyricimonas aerilata]
MLLGSAAALGSAALGSTLLSGCATGPGSNVAQLKFWHLLSGGDGVVMAGLVEAANEANTTFHATQTVLTWGAPYYTKLAMASAGGRAPDLAVMHASRIPGYAPGGLLDPWDLSLLREFGVTEQSFPARIWEKGFIDDRLYSIALDAHPFVMMYNTDYAEQAGVLDSDGKLVETTSPEEFIEVARAMQGASGNRGLSYGYLNDGAQMWRLWYTFYRQMEGEIELPVGGEARIDEEPAVRSFEFMQQLLDDDIATSRNDYATAVAEFVSGQSGIFFTGVWELPTMKNAELPVGGAPIPTLFGTPAAYADSHAFVLPHQTQPDEKKRREAYRFVAEILKGSFDWAGAGHIPAYVPITEDPAYAELSPQADYAGAAEIINYDPPAWFTGSGSDFQNIFGEFAQPVLLSGADPAAAVSGFRQRLNALLSKPNPV